MPSSCTKCSGTRAIRCVLIADFPGASVIDRRNNPSYGYRAVHVIAEISGKPVEIQVRTSLQHLWAEVSEKSSDVLDPTIKYGGGSESWRNFLTRSSASVAAYEKYETACSKEGTAYELMVAAHQKFKKVVAELPEHHVPDHEVQEIRGKLEDSTRKMERAEHEHQEMRAELVRSWKVIAELLSEAISRLDKLREEKQ